MSLKRRWVAVLALAPAFSLASCDDPIERAPAPANEGVFSFANGCYSVEGFEAGVESRWLAPALSGHGFAFSATDAEEGSRFFLKASDLGTYLFYDQDGGYLFAEDGPLERREQLLSDILTIDDT